MKIYPSEIQIGQRLIKGYQSFRVIDKVKETSKTITFLMKHYKGDMRCVGDFTEKEVTFRKTTIVESRTDEIGTKLNELHKIKPERLKDIINRGFELYQVKRKQIYSWGDDGLEVGDYMFAMFNGINYETEKILDDGTVNSIPPSKNSDKQQLSGWSNKNGGFEDYYEKVDMNIIFKRMEKF
jgi:hypothetical protein